jgi:hypothetical protein
LFTSVKSEANVACLFIGHFLLLKIDDIDSFIGMNNQITIISGILSVTLLLPTITAEFLTLAAPNAFGQQAFLTILIKAAAVLHWI